MARPGRSRVKGIISFRRLLRRLPESANKTLAGFLGEVGPALAGFMRTIFPNRTGALDAGIVSKLAAKSLRLRVGLVTKRSARTLFYGHILDVDHKTGGRGHGRATAESRAKPSRIIPGLYATSKTSREFRDRYLPRYGRLMDGILSDAAQGIGDD